MIFLSIVLVPNLCAQIKLNKPGLKINTSISIVKGDYLLEATNNTDPLIDISGNDITIDFNNTVLSGSKNITEPDKFNGVAVHIHDCKNVTIMNATIKGYKIAVLAQNVSNLNIVNCNFSYNYRPKLYSQKEYEDYADWLSYHHNEKGEWKSYGAAVYLVSCNEAFIKSVKIEQGFNGVMLTNCNKCQLYNNNIQYNSGVGIALYRSSDNKIMHNKLSWNVRGFSHGYYSRGQDSAGILVYEQSDNNIIAYNLATHSGDGFFLWAGQTTMDSGKGGCNDNMIYGNDFSYSPTNGIELTFSRNIIYNNKLIGCENGIWAGYSYNTLIFANRFQDNKRDIAIEQGQDNSIRMNLFNNSIVGIDIWQNKDQPDWSYSKSKDVSSRNYDIERNQFKFVQTPFSICSSKDVTISYNQVGSANELLHVASPNTNLSFTDNDIQSTSNWGDAEKWKETNKNTISSSSMALSKEYANRLVIPLPLEDAQENDPSEIDTHTRKDILINGYGPYNFKYPYLFLDEKTKNEYSFQVYGPKGNWEVLNTRGLAIVNDGKGLTPSSIKAAQKWKEDEDVEIVLEWKGEAFTDQFGQYHKEGDPVVLNYSRFNPNMKWIMNIYNVPKDFDLLNMNTALSLLKTKSVKTDTLEILRFAWWSPPSKTILSDKYLTQSESVKYFEPGVYNIFVSSDDGVVVYIDDKEIFKNWSIHESMTDKISIKLNGEHKIKLIHFNGGGFANIQWRMERVK